MKGVILIWRDCLTDVNMPCISLATPSLKSDYGEMLK
jgi:hypothetical protein